MTGQETMRRGRMMARQGKMTTRKTIRAGQEEVSEE